jgi:hypothetical protein
VQKPRADCHIFHCTFLPLVLTNPQRQALGMYATISFHILIMFFPAKLFFSFYFKALNQGKTPTFPPATASAFTLMEKWCLRHLSGRF